MTPVLCAQARPRATGPTHASLPPRVANTAAADLIVRRARTRGKTKITESLGTGTVRICHVVLFGELDGSQRSMLAICRRLDRRRFEPHVICQGRGSLTDALELDGIPWTAAPSLTRSIHPWRDLRGLWQMMVLLRRLAPQIVHTHSSKVGFLGRLAARLVGVPVAVHHVRGLPFHEASAPWRRRLFSRLEALAGAWCDRVLFVNHEERRLAVDRGLLPESRCVTILNGVEIEAFDGAQVPALRQSFRHRCQAVEHEVLILFCGRLVRQKDPLILPEIARLLEERRPDEPWRIVVAGCGPLGHQLDERIEQLGLAKRFLRLGWVADPVPATVGCDIALLPSRWEGLPRVLLEAQAAGRPVVTSDITGSREAIDESTGMLCRVGEPADYAAALDALFDPERRRCMGDAGRRRARQRFRVESTVASVVEVYDELLGPDGPA
ncbi:MAG: glycosyltransferase family 4 protein [Acidobacteriota bacterium]